MTLEFGYGSTTEAVTAPDGMPVTVLTPNRVSAELTGEAEVLRALASPIGSPRLGDIVKPGERIAIVTSDLTRPMPSAKVLPPVLDELRQAGVRNGDITIVFALGSHRRQTADEMRRLVSDEVFAAYRCEDGDPDDCVRMGVTANGTPVDITRAVAEADRRICLGNIEYHYFAGYSGGAKAIMPGVSTRAAIQANHSRMTAEAACAGRLDGNPVREDIEEAARMCPIDFIVNVVLDEHKRIVKAVAGDAVTAHRAGCAFLDTLFGIPIADRADIVLVSQGGAPKDINLYQTQKALDNAKHAVKKGGTVILIGRCGEGLGEKTFAEWLLAADSPDSLISRIEADFRLGGHKAAAIAMVRRNAEIYLVSDLPEDMINRAFFTPFPTAQAAFDAALAKHGRDSAVIAMPYGGSTLPLPGRA